MSIWELFLTAVALSMDAMAVAVSAGLSNAGGKGVKFREAGLMGLFFGVFQAVMPLLGYYIIPVSYTHLTLPMKPTASSSLPVEKLKLRKTMPVASASMLVAIAITNSVPSANGFDGSASSSARTASIIILPPRKTSSTNAIQWSVPLSLIHI